MAQVAQLWAKITFMATTLSSLKNVAQKVALNTIRAVFGSLGLSSWQFSYLVILVLEKAQSSSWQNKKLRTYLLFSSSSVDHC